MKKTVSVMIAVLLIAMSAVSAFAVPAPWYMGDANSDGNFDITDATAIQKYAAGIIIPKKLQVDLSDVDGDGEITVKDASLVQKVIAGTVKRSEIKGSDISTYMLFHDFRADFDSGKAMVGMPVTFTVDVETPAEPLTYEFYIDGVLVGERSTENTFTYTFESAGTYDIRAVAYNKYDESESNEMGEYRVVEAYFSETPVISSLHLSYRHNFVYGRELEMSAIANAVFGKAPYEYRFERVGYEEETSSSTVLETRDFSEDNRYDFIMDYEDLYNNIKVNVTVRDADGNTVTESVNVY